MKIMKHLLLILVGGILLNACSDDREMDDGRWKASALRVPLEVSSAVIKQEVVTRLAPDPVPLTEGAIGIFCRVQKLKADKRIADIKLLTTVNTFTAKVIGDLRRLMIQFI